MHVPSRAQASALVIAGLLLAAAAAAALVIEATVDDGADTPAAISPRSVSASHRGLPLAFEPNRGQGPTDADYLAAGDGFTVSLDKDVVAIRSGNEMFRMRLVGGQATLHPDAALPGRSNYFRGSEPGAWIADVPQYARMRFASAWPGIDVIVYGTAGGALEYDFIVAPGADPAHIGLAFEGARRTRLAEDGALVLELARTNVRHDPPTIYQPSSSGRDPVAGSYDLRADGTVRYHVGDYDGSRALIIDPVVEFSTFLGGSQNDVGRGIAIDASLNSYVVGETNSTGFPTTTGTLDVTANGNKDVFVTKLSADLSTLVYSTYLGGNLEDAGYGIKVDASGNAYITGHTNSSGTGMGGVAFPTTVGAHDTNLNGGQDAFVAKLNPNGSALVYSTFLGGNGVDSGRGIAIDANGTAYVTGRTDSNNFPTTMSNRIDTLDGGFDAFLARLNATATGAVMYGTYLGGTGDDEGLAVAVNPSVTNHRVYVTGYTNGAYDTTASALDTTHNGGRDVFVSSINTTAATAAAANLFGTYIGGTADEQGNAADVHDSADTVYVGGQTLSSGFPTTTGRYDTTYNGAGDGFVLRLDQTGGALLQATFLGGTGADEVDGLDVDNDNQTHVTGRTTSTDFPQQAGAGPAGGEDAFVTSLDGAFTGLTFSTYLGGAANERGLGLVVDAIDDIYVTGHTTSTDFPTTPGANDTSNNGNTDVFVTKLGVLEADVGLAKADSPDPVVVNSSLTYFLNVTNAGPNDAEDVTLQDDLPAGVIVQTNTTTQGSCAQSGASLVCDLGTIALGQTVHVNITVTPTTTGVINNSATVFSNVVLDPATENNAAFELTTVVRSADLRVTKEDSPEPVLVNGTLTYYVNATNLGPTYATNVTVVDALPPDATFVSATPEEGSCGQTAGIVTCALGPMQPGASVNITIVVSPTNPGLITNKVNITSDDPDPNAANNNATEQTLVETLADLSITKDDSPDPAEENGNLTYFLNVTNHGPTRATNVTVTDDLDANVTFVSATSEHGTCAHTTPTVTCELGTMEPGATVNVTLIVRSDQPGAYLNQASATSDDPDPDLANNTALESTNATPQPADISITKEDSPDPVMEGTALTYHLNVTNHGPGDAHDVLVHDELPPSVVFLAVAQSQGSCSESAGIVDCNLGTLDPGENASVEISARPAGRGNVTNTASALASEPDLNLANNNHTQTTFVTPRPVDLNVTKLDNQDPLGVGQNLTYTVTVQNLGPGNATNVSLTDVSQPGTLFVLANSTQGSCAGGAVLGVTTVECDLGDIPANDSAVVTVVVKPQSPGRVTNTANASADEDDINLTNNLAIEQTTVLPPPEPEADLNLTKTGDADLVLVGQRVNYTLVASNDGPDVAENVTVLDDVPASFVIEETNATQGPGCAIAASLVTCVLGDLAPGANATIRIGVRPTAPGAFNNAAVVTANTSDPAAQNNFANETTGVESLADLVLTKDDSPDPVVVGQTLTYHLNVTNAGPTRATNVTVQDTLPPSVTYLSSSTEQGACAQSDGNVTCGIGEMASGARVNITIAVAPNSLGVIANTANVTADDPDPQPANNNATEITLVREPQADLNVTKTDNPDPVGVGQDLAYTITVHNAGPENATNVTLADHVQPTADFVDANSTQGSCSASTDAGAIDIVCDLGTLGVGDSAVVTIVVRPLVAGTLVDFANVSATQSDPNAVDNSTQESTRVTLTQVPEADLALTKADDRDPVRVGERLNYTLGVRNHGPDTAQNVTLTDDLPEDLVIGSTAPSQGAGCTTVGNLVTCALGSLAANATATVKIEVVPTRPGTFEDRAFVASDASDPAAGNNWANETTTAQPAEPVDRPAPPEDLECRARRDGNELSWSPSENATGYNVYRAIGDGPFALYANTVGTSYSDAGVDAGTVYRYRVTALNAAGESAPSAECETTAIPFFSGWAIGVAASVGSLGAYVLWRRMRR